MGIAADRYARITREQWQDYVKHGIPIENKLISMFKSQGSSVGDTTSLASKVYSNLSPRTDMFLARYGLSQTAAQRRENEKADSLARVIGLAMLRDRMRQAKTDLNQQILLGTPGTGLDVIGD